MIVLGIDGGAERLGWGLLERGDKPIYLDSGIISLPRGSKVYQAYRLEIISFYVENLWRLIDDPYIPIDVVVNETVPAAGTFNGTQMYLVNAVVAAIQALTMERGIKVDQIGATSVQSRIAVGKKGRKTSKVQVRNGVIELLPELLPRKSEWVKVFEEPDALAVGLAYMEYSNNGSKGKSRAKA